MTDKEKLKNIPKEQLDNICRDIFDGKYKRNIFESHDDYFGLSYSYYEILDNNVKLHFSYVNGDCGCSAYNEYIVIPIDELFKNIKEI